MKDILITPNNTTESVAGQVVEESGRGCNLSVKMCTVAAVISYSHDCNSITHECHVVFASNTKSWLRQIGHETLKTGGYCSHNTIKKLILYA